MLKINWKVRFKNKPFLVGFIALVATFVNSVAELFGADVTLLTDKATHIAFLIISFLVAIGYVIDPTTEGFEDSNRAMSYEEPKKEEE